MLNQRTELNPGDSLSNGEVTKNTNRLQTISIFCSIKLVIPCGVHLIPYGTLGHTLKMIENFPYARVVYQDAYYLKYSLHYNIDHDQLGTTCFWLCHIIFCGCEPSR